MHLDAGHHGGLGEGAGHDDDDPAGPAGVAVATTASEALATPPSSRHALRRRRQVFFGLLAALATSMTAAVLVSSLTAWLVHASIGVIFVAYVGLLVAHHQRALEHEAKVRYLPPVRQPVRVQRPAVVVLRSGTAR